MFQILANGPVAVAVEQIETRDVTGLARWHHVWDPDEDRGNEDDEDDLTTCGCGWDGEYSPGASGQRCPSCGQTL